MLSAMMSRASPSSIFISLATIFTAASRFVFSASVAFFRARRIAFSVLGFSFSILPLTTTPACTWSQSTWPSLPGMKLRLPVKYTWPPACFTALKTHGAQAAMASMSPLASAEMDVAGAPHRRQIGTRDVPARVDLDAFGPEIAQLLGHRELGGHLRIAHEPGIDLGHLELGLGQGVARSREADQQRQQDDQGSHRLAPFEQCASDVRWPRASAASAVRPPAAAR